MTKSILWWLLTHRFWSPVFCDRQLSLISMCAPVFTVSESTSYFVVVVLSLSTFFVLTNSILWWLLIHRFWSSSICEGQLSLDTICAANFIANESRSYFIVELLSLSLHCFNTAKSFLWWLLTHRFWSSIFRSFFSNNEIICFMYFESPFRSSLSSLSLI